MAADAQEKTEEATPRKKQEARRKGTVTKSTDLVGALSLLAIAFISPGVSKALGASMLRALDSRILEAPTEVSYGSILRYAQGFIGPIAAAGAPIILTTLVVGVVANFAQVGFVFSLEPLNPTLDKINPFNGLKRLFSARAGVEGLKALFKFGVFGALAYGAVAADWNQIIGLSWLAPSQSMAVAGTILHTILVRVAIAWLAMAALDYFFQRAQVQKQLRMSRDELKREMKEQEGSPEVKAAQYRKRRQLSKGALAKRVQKADVVVVNPTHFSVAIQYERSTMHAPMVVAKGQDYLALRIREIAAEYQVPIVPSPPLARALYKQCEVGDYVPRDLFAPVAEVLAFVYKTVKGVRG